MEAGMLWMLGWMMLPGVASLEGDLSAMDNSAGGCVYTFHAWVPSQASLGQLHAAAFNEHINLMVIAFTGILILWKSLSIHTPNCIIKDSTTDSCFVPVGCVEAT